MAESTRKQSNVRPAVQTDRGGRGGDGTRAGTQQPSTADCLAALANTSGSSDGNASASVGGGDSSSAQQAGDAKASKVK